MQTKFKKKKEKKNKTLIICTEYAGHRYCKAFITHGGLNSIQEAIYHGVPLLGMPLGTDQSLNVARSVKEGYAVQLDWSDVTDDSLTSAIQNLLHNPRY